MRDFIQYKSDYYNKSVLFLHLTNIREYPNRGQSDLQPYHPCGYPGPKPLPPLAHCTTTTAPNLRPPTACKSQFRPAHPPSILAGAVGQESREQLLSAFKNLHFWNTF